MNGRAKEWHSYFVKPLSHPQIGLCVPLVNLLARLFALPYFLVRSNRVFFFSNLVSTMTLNKAILVSSIKG